MPSQGRLGAHEDRLSKLYFDIYQAVMGKHIFQDHRALGGKACRSLLIIQILAWPDASPKDDWKPMSLTAHPFDVYRRPGRVWGRELADKPRAYLVSV